MTAVCYSHVINLQMNNSH